MKKKLYWVLVGLGMMLFSFVPKNAFASTHAENKVVKMGYFEYGSMCRGASEGAPKSGYVYDFMQKIATYTGWEYEYTYGTYAEVYDALKEERIDILPYTNWNEQRDEEVLFSKNAMLEEQYYLASRPDDTSIVNGDVSSLNNKIIATVKGADQNSLLEKYITNNGIIAEIRYFDNPELSWDALANKEVDAAVFSNISYRNNVDWNVFGSFGEKPTYIAVSINNSALLKELDDAIDTLEQTNPSFISEIQKEIYSGSPALLCLTEKEKEWLNKHETIRIGYIEGTNLTYAKKNADGTYAGFIPELINNIFTTLKINNNVQYFGYKTPAEAGEDILSNRIDTAYPFFPSFAFGEEHQLIISNTFNESSIGVVYKNNVGFAGSMKKVAVLSSSITQYYLQTYNPETEIVIVNKIDEAVNLLNSNKVTGFASETSDTTTLVQTYRDFSQYILSKGCATTFATKLIDSPLIVILNRGVSSLSDAEISALVANNTKSRTIEFSEYAKSHPEVLALVILVPIFIAGLVIIIIVVSRLRKRAQAASKAKTDFLFNMSHDIRTPMNAIIGYTNSALRHKEDLERVTDNLKKIKLSSNHLLKLINDILEMSRIESGNVELAQNPLNIYDEVRKIDDMVQTLAANKSITFNVTINRISNPYVYGDGLHVNQILINLVSNAIKYTNEGGKIDFIVSQISNVIDDKVILRFEVNDTGIGMSDEFQKHLFESFSREKTSTVSKQEGTGLGLSIVKKIVDLSDGRIYFKSKLNEGTQFTVELPFKVLKDDAIEAFKKENEIISSKNRSESLIDKRVLLVEDNEMNREIATEILSDAGCLVETAEDGSVAVNILKEKGEMYYDFVLMDIQMPVLNGYEATKQIRKIYPKKKLPIIAVSANAFKEDKDASLAAGMNAHISKPINPQELIDELLKLSN